MHADIHKGAEIHDISDRASEFHPRLQIFQRKNILPQDRPLHIQSGVPPRLRKLRKDVLQSVFTKSGIPGKLLQRKASIAGRMPPAVTFIEATRSRSFPVLPPAISCGVYPSSFKTILAAS